MLAVGCSIDCILLSTLLNTWRHRRERKFIVFYSMDRGAWQATVHGGHKASNMTEWLTLHSRWRSTLNLEDADKGSEKSGHFSSRYPGHISHFFVCHLPTTLHSKANHGQKVVLSLVLFRPYTIDCSPSGFSVHRILQARILEWVAMPFSRGYSDPGIKPASLCLLNCGRFFTHWVTWESWPKS